MPDRSVVEEQKALLREASAYARARMLSARRPGDRDAERLPLGECVQPFRSIFDRMTPEQIRKHDEEARRRCNEEEARNRREMILRLKAAARVPLLFAMADLDNLGDAPVKYLRTAEKFRELLTRRRLIALCGTRGAGKTHLACALINAAVRQGLSAVYTTAADLFSDIRRAFHPGGPTQPEAEARYTRPRILVVDELQNRADTPWEANKLTSIIDARYHEPAPSPYGQLPRPMRSTVLISNLEPQAFVDQVGDSIASRVEGNGELIVCSWESFRSKFAGRELEGRAEALGLPLEACA